MSTPPPGLNPVAPEFVPPAAAAATATAAAATATAATATATASSVPIQYVISAHGLPNGFGFTLPPNFGIQFYSDPGKKLFCTRHLQTQVCSGTVSANPDWRHYGWIEDYNLSADEYDPSSPTSFLSGMVECNPAGKNKVLFNLTTASQQYSAQFPGQTLTYTLSQLVYMLSFHHYTNYGFQPAILHYLACRGAEEGGSGKTTRKQTRRRITKKNKNKNKNKNRKTKKAH